MRLPGGLYKKLIDLRIPLVLVVPGGTKTLYLILYFLDLSNTYVENVLLDDSPKVLPNDIRVVPTLLTESPSSSESPIIPVEPTDTTLDPNLILLLVEEITVIPTPTLDTLASGIATVSVPEVVETPLIDVVKPTLEYSV